MVDGASRATELMRIADAAREVGVSPSALRLWEQQGLVAPRRVGGRERRYGTAELERLRRIRRLRTVDGLNAAGIRRILGDVSAPGPDAAMPGPNPSPGARGSSPLGSHLRAMRTRARLSLREVARRAGLSASFISSLERGTSGASVAALVRLAGAYGTSVGVLVDGGTTTEARGRRRAAAGVADRVVRCADRKAVDAGSGVRIEELCTAPSQLQPQLFVLAPGATSEGSYEHRGEEFLFVLEGSVAVWLADTERHDLATGDALTFASSIPHRFVALGGGETRILWVNTPPTF